MNASTKDLAGYLPGEQQRVIERNKANGWQDMSGEDRAFCIAFLETFSHVKAAREIGQPGKGMKYMRRPLVNAFLAEAQKDQLHQNLITEQFVREKWMELLPKLMGEEEVDLITAQGEASQKKKFHSAETVAVLREMSKSTKFYNEGSGSGGVNLTINMGSMTTQDPATVTIEGEIDGD